VDVIYNDFLKDFYNGFSYFKIESLGLNLI